MDCPVSGQRRVERSLLSRIGLSTKGGVDGSAGPSDGSGRASAQQADGLVCTCVVRKYRKTRG